MPEPPRSIPAEDLAQTETGQTVAGNRVSLSRHVAIARGDAIDRYEVRDEIGAGGVGVVLEAFDPDLERRVAIKLLQVRRTTDPESARAMLLREGQAIAQLSHPNVVSVFDVGDHGDEMFIAMEYVAGDSLKQWMSGGAKHWRDVVPLFLQAGRGLSAAHAADIVHRDFKPSNVLIGDDGRVRVLDFGLARVFDDGDTAELDGGERILSQTLTVSGSIAGTPAYMSPEQYAGEVPDARSDMFSFCVALYEALAGRRPFAGNDVAELSANVLGGKMRGWPAGNETPRWLRTVVERGLAVDPADRHASMGDLLDELARDPARTKRMIAVAALVVVAFAAVIYLGLVRDRGGAASACSTGDDRMAAIWDDGREAKLVDAFRTTDVNHWKTTADTVAKMLHERSTAWVSKHADVCEATSGGEQSEAALDARMRCLDRRALELRATVERLLEADAELVDKAIKVVSDLPELGPCDDVENLLLIAPLPDDVERRERIEAVQGRLEAARVVFNAGEYEDAKLALEAIIADAEQVGFPRLIADGKFLLARAAALVYDVAAAETLYNESIAAAAAARDAHLEAHASVGLLRIVAQPKRPVEMVRQVERAAKTAVARAGNDGVLVGRLLSAQAILADRVDNDPKGAYEIALQSHEAMEKALGPRSLRAAKALYQIAHLALKLGELDEALEVAQRALEIEEVLLGSEHPDLNDTLFVICRTLQQQGKVDEAAARFERIVANTERRFGTHSPRLGSMLQPLASVRASQGKFDVAVELLERALELDGDHPRSVETYSSSLGRVYGMSGELDKALVHFERALSAAEETHGVGSDKLVTHLVNLGMLSMNSGNDAKAVEFCGRVGAIHDATLGPDNKARTMLVAMICLAGASLNLGKVDEGLSAAQRAVRVAEARGDDPVTAAQGRFFLGRAQYMAGDTAKGLATVNKARAELASAKRPPALLGQIDAWLAKNQ
jgi:tetratricopeptide (TPR) repeat protein/tRNA A-37 threonylcarbamoyl transferase component Bud32